MVMFIVILINLKKPQGLFADSITHNYGYSYIIAQIMANQIT